MSYSPRERGGVAAPSRRVAAVGGGYDISPEPAGDPGLRARQVRQLHRPAAARHQSAAARFRVREDRGLMPGPSELTPCGTRPTYGNAEITARSGPAVSTR